MKVSRIIQFLTTIWRHIATPKQNGPSKPLESLSATGSSAPTPQPVSTDSVPADSSIKPEVKQMSFSLSAVATALTTVASAVKASEVIYEAGAQLIQIAENAYSNASGSGATKKVAVLAALEALCTEIGEDWSTIKAEISAWIDMVIQTWNTLKSFVTPMEDPTPVADANPTAVDGTATEEAV
ncbi:hypothetical protein [Sodalis ligni]|uniref:Uncharacterized protein n=1 Tax=Sodalis ligni TaxID=2697027 RepID=A0A4R1NQ65_9GAMM|nr:hypothetical protein [Sodalis ligni]TCL06886.1 hypothetical protein EZJ58_5183 [Sodalis ligni]